MVERFNLCSMETKQILYLKKTKNEIERESERDSHPPIRTANPSTEDGIGSKPLTATITTTAANVKKKFQWTPYSETCSCIFI